MKRMLLLLVCTLCLSLTVFAANGDINGVVYESDITAVINGITVPSYNIGGRTVVVVEDITTAHYYNDDLRTLLIGDLSPSVLVAGHNTPSGSPVGTKVGNTFESDIQTYIYDVKIPCYSLNGKMAVAIEDLGGDNTFTKTGGRYIWDAKTRTITLETIHFDVSPISDILQKKRVSLVSEDGVHASFISKPIQYGSISGFRYFEDGSPKAIYVEDSIIGYSFYPAHGVFSMDENDNVQLSFDHRSSLFYFNIETIENLLKDVTPKQPTREEWLEYYQSNMMTVLDKLETDAYTFLYMSQPNPHGSSQFLRRIAADGTVICYENDFQSMSLHGQKYFDNVTIDKESETVSFRYDKSYTIDLKSGEYQ